MNIEKVKEKFSQMDVEKLNRACKTILDQVTGIDDSTTVPPELLRKNTRRALILLHVYELADWYRLEKETEELYGTKPR